MINNFFGGEVVVVGVEVERKKHKTKGTSEKLKN